MAQAALASTCHLYPMCIDEIRSTESQVDAKQNVFALLFVISKNPNEPPSRSTTALFTNIYLFLINGTDTIRLNV